jgi:LCP family protein required for cell wall assembly
MKNVQVAVAPPPQSESGCRTAAWALLLLLGLGILLVVVLFWLAQAQSPTTFLITGVDQRSGETGPTRGDVILLMHVDPKAERTVMMSVPRDLWLPQPDGTTGRINTALVAGYDPENPDSGPDYLAQTLSMNFDVDVEGYFLFNFDGFVDVIDAVDGIDVDVPVTIVDEAYPTEDYGVQTIRFEAGPQQLDGEQALIYVRTRHQDSDFGRAVRQQQVIQALAQKIVWPQSWIRIPALVVALQQNAQTDVPLTKLPLLALAAYYVSSGQVETLVLNEEYVTPWVTESGAYVLLPRWEVIEPALQTLFIPSGRVN